MILTQTHIILICCCFVLLVFCIWKESRRINRINLWWRILAISIAVISLACLALPLVYHKSITRLSRGLLLTDGVDASQFARLKENNTYTSFAWLNREGAAVPDFIRRDPAIREVREPLAFINNLPTQEPVSVAGFGLDEDEWQLLPQPGNSEFIPAPAPGGFTGADWQRTIRSGQAFDLQGVFNNVSGEMTMLRLTAFGRVVDSVTTDKKGPVSFRFRFIPAGTGPAIFELSTGSKSGTITEKIPVMIRPAIPLRILVLSSAPDFETKFISSWLADEGHEVTVRSTISPGQYLTRRLNNNKSGQAGGSPLSSNQLARTDLVIAGDQALAELTIGESALLRTQLAGGLGLLIQADSNRPLSPFAHPFGIRNTGAAATSPLLDGRAEPLAIPVSNAISPAADQQPVINGKSTIVAASRLEGSGRVVFTTINGTYSWALEGRRAVYAGFWSRLINAAVRAGTDRAGRNQDRDNQSINNQGRDSHAAPTRWTSNQSFPIIDAPVGISFNGESDSIPLVRTSNGNLYPARDAVDPSRWSASWWPRTEGWNGLDTGDSIAVFVFGKKDWLAARQTKNLEASLYYGRASRPEGDHGVPIRETRPVPEWIFYFTLLLSMGYLWIEARKNRV